MDEQRNIHLYILDSEGMELADFYLFESQGKLSAELDYLIDIRDQDKQVIDDIIGTPGYVLSSHPLRRSTDKHNKNIS